MKKVFSLVAFLCVTIVMYAQVIERFTNSNVGNSYSTGSFVGDGNIVWNYEKARGNQKTTTNNDKAISLNKAADACLYSDTIANGIKVLQFQYEQELTANCDASVFLNDICVGFLQTEDEVDVTKIFSFITNDFPKNVVVRIQQNSSSSGQLTIDDIYIEFAENQEEMPQDTIEVVQIRKPKINEIVISEIMADPEPIVGLPDFEYVEICNVSDTIFQCSDVQLVVGKNTCDLPQKCVEPNEYFCVISEKARDFIPDTSHFVFVKSFPSIANGGQTIALVSDGEIISSVCFSDSWYQDDFKANGGWSLEKIDVENYSETMENWSVAKNRVGGTPGYENSVNRKNPDLTNPQITTIQITSDSSFVVSFSENFDKDIFIKNSSVFPDNQQFKCESVDFSLSQYSCRIHGIFEVQKEYILELNDDCVDFDGNQFAENQYVFAMTDSLQERNSVAINEILFNPISGYSDFVELYNNSDSYFDLSKMYISNKSDYQKFTSSFLLFPPHSYCVISPDAADYKSQSECKNSIFVAAKLPTFADDEGCVMLLSSWEEIIDSVCYNKSWHSAYLSDAEGVSLERIDVLLSSTLSSNWFSASETAGFSTPGCENSQARNRNDLKNISIESEVVTPNGDGENDELLVLFNEVEIGTLCNVFVFATSGELIKQVTTNHLLGAGDVIRWNCTNSENKLVSVGIYLVCVELLSDGKKIDGEKFSCSVLRE